MHERPLTQLKLAASAAPARMHAGRRSGALSAPAAAATPAACRRSGARAAAPRRRRREARGRSPWLQRSGGGRQCGALSDGAAAERVGRGWSRAGVEPQRCYRLWKIAPCYWEHKRGPGAPGRAGRVQITSRGHCRGFVAAQWVPVNGCNTTLGQGAVRAQWHGRTGDLLPAPLSPAALRPCECLRWDIDATFIDIKQFCTPIRSAGPRTTRFDWRGERSA